MRHLLRYSSHTDISCSSGGSARRLHSVTESPHMVHRAERDHGNHYGSHVRLLHRRHRQCAGKSHERAVHTGLLQLYAKLCGHDNHGIYHRHHAYIRMYQRGSYCFASTLVLRSRRRRTVLALAILCSARMEYSIACRLCVGGYQLTLKSDQYWI